MKKFFKVLTAVTICVLVLINSSWAYYNFDYNRIEEEAENGHPEAQYYLAQRYDMKKDGDPEKNLEIAAKWYKKSAEQGYAEAQFSIGNFYRHGIGVEKDIDEAIKWLKKGADQGNIWCAKSLKKAIQEAEIAAKNNPVKKISKEKPLDKVQVEKFNILIKEAENGHIDSQYQVGEMYVKGNGVHKNEKEAAIWFQKAANLGHKKAQHNIGLLYYMAPESKQNTEKAIEWFTKASDQGVTDSTFMLGQIYMEGKGGIKNTERGFNYLYVAAEKGHPEAQNSVGYCYATGDCPNVSVNIEKAKEWFIKAARQGNINAMKNRKVVGFEQARDRYLKSRYGSSSGGYKIKDSGDFWKGVVVIAGISLILSEIEKISTSQSGSKNSYTETTEQNQSQVLNNPQTNHKHVFSDPSKKDELSRLLSCAGQATAAKLINNPVAAGAIVEAIRASIENDHYSFSGATSVSAKSYIANKLRNEGNEEAALMVEIGDFIWCTIQAYQYSNTKPGQD